MTVSTAETLESHLKGLKEECPDFSEDTFSTLYALACHLYENGKYEDSRQTFRFLTISDAFNRSYWMGLGASYQKLKDYSGAIECYSVAAIQQPEDPYVHLHAADCFFALGQTGKALLTLDSAITAAERSDASALLNQLKKMRQAWTNDTEKE